MVIIVSSLLDVPLKGVELEGIKVWFIAGSFWIFTLECIGTVVFVALYVPETRGRTLEQIEASFR